MEIDIRKMQLTKIRVGNEDKHSYNVTLICQRGAGVCLTHGNYQCPLSILTESDADNLIEGLKLAKELGWFDKNNSL